MPDSGKRFTQDETICLSRRDFSETSLTLVLLCRQAGKVSVLAKGAKRPKSPLAIDLLDMGRASLLIKPEGLGLLTEFADTHALPELRRDLRKWQTGLYLSELANLATKDLAPATELFDLLSIAIQETCQSTSRADLAKLLVATTRGILTWAGYEPQLRRCIGCGKTLGPADQLFFSAPDGGVLCRDCEGAVVDKIRLEHRAWYYLLGKVSDPISAGKAFVLLNLMIRDHMGRPPRMEKYCRPVFSNE